MSKLGRTFGKIGSFIGGPKKPSVGQAGGFRPSSGGKIYAKNIEKIPVSRFKKISETYKVNDGSGQRQELGAGGMKKELQRMTHGGRLAPSLDRELRRRGMSGSQMKIRQELVTEISGKKDGAAEALQKKLNTRQAVNARIRAEGADIMDRLSDKGQSARKMIESISKESQPALSGASASRASINQPNDQAQISISAKNTSVSDSVVPTKGDKDVTVVRANKAVTSKELGGNQKGQFNTVSSNIPGGTAQNDQ